MRADSERGQPRNEGSPPKLADRATEVRGQSRRNGQNPPPSTKPEGMPTGGRSDREGE